MKTKFKLTLVLALTVLAGCATVQAVNSIRGSDVSSMDVPPVDLVYAGKGPGEYHFIDRTFKEQPPLIPHSIDIYQISATENACLDCHIDDSDFKGKKMPAVSKAHLVAQASADAEPELNKARWQCNSCHVPQVDAKPLVENTFQASPTRRQIQ